MDVWKEEDAAGTEREDREVRVAQAKGEPSRFELLKSCTLHREAGLQDCFLASPWETPLK